MTMEYEDGIAEDRHSMVFDNIGHTDDPYFFFFVGDQKLTYDRYAVNRGTTYKDEVFAVECVENGSWYVIPLNEGENRSPDDGQHTLGPFCKDEAVSVATTINRLNGEEKWRSL